MTQQPAPITSPNDLWAAIEALSAPKAKARAPASKALSDANAVELERQLIGALCAPMRPRWTDIAQVLIVHHWQCTCGASGTFPNFDSQGHDRKVRRTAPDGSTWICSSEHIKPELPIEPYPVHHTTPGCPSCIHATSPAQQQFAFGEPLPLRKRNSATICRRMTCYV